MIVTTDDTVLYMFIAERLNFVVSFWMGLEALVIIQNMKNKKRKRVF